MDDGSRNDYHFSFAYPAANTNAATADSTTHLQN